MTHPWDDSEATFLVLVNSEGQHSLWPSRTAVPAGWTTVCGPAAHQLCVAYVDEHWTDMRPKSLIDHHDRYAKEGSR
ncbi:MbtH family protein [Streptomyces clavuligerus]|uniref:MbtH family protein n=1 Tax=Streptomyces clavuligerus TaxID=1901 RepID=UPI000810EE96|nr:MbtH family protein [Streptomyces clavuligerus]ANW17098.1 hypothetical protein BB341_02115 [Streptomyces clavuligerus]AXU11637.1 MbtH family protein [Streptomyces clavuligerus]MBY6301472.1 MbtH family protein [Streptomyces clavuligerus]QPL61757.1 MbtH family protein [Streptomyces clavuligerus]QPL67790.1 MbtH family protein [Streptomyces clavuligerus]